MFSKDQLLNPYRFNLKYAFDLVSDLTDEQMYTSPAKGLENHPGFTLGHLVTGSNLVARHLGDKCDLPDGWAEMFQRKGPGDPRLPDFKGVDPPPKSQLLQELKDKHRIVEARIIALDEDKLNEPCEWRFAGHFPTLGDMLMFMCVTHEAMHLGQIAAWRRSFGLDSSLARL